MRNQVSTSLLTPSGQRKLVLTHLEELNTPRSLAIWMILTYEEFDDQVLDLKVDPLWFNSADSYLEFSLPSSVLKKWTGLNLSTDPDAEALKKFLAAEDSCKDSNRRIRTSVPPGRVASILDAARKKLSSVLPAITPEFLDTLGDLGEWGSGVTSSCKGRWVHFYNKLGAVPQATPALLPIANALLRESPWWSELHPSGCQPLAYNSVAFVPKTAKTKRAIAVEPSLNAFLQRGVGRALHGSLLKMGINLHSQDKNQAFALRGSQTGDRSTIDLESASDTICTAIVEYLFPSDWVALLGILRSPHYVLPGDETIHRYHKWSSMGNGYTFELESLLFGSLCAVICGHNPSKYSVYGDDIIVPVDEYDILVECLEWCGFRVNSQKSFKQGPFRESCGKDYFYGVDVRSFYLKDWTFSTPFVWANALRSLECYKPFRISRTWRSIIRATPYRAFGPRGSHGLLLFEVNDVEFDPTMRALIRRPYKARMGVLVSGWRWRPKVLNSSRVDGPAAVASHVRQLTDRSWFMESRPLSVSGRDYGTWLQNRSLVCDDWPRLRFP